jgi:hypothetical protein
MRASRVVLGCVLFGMAWMTAGAARAADGTPPGATRSTGAMESGVELVIAPDVEQSLAALAPTEIRAEIGDLSAHDRAALTEIIAAARELDPIFRRQVWSGNEALEAELSRARGPRVEAAREYYRLMQGPWDRLDGDRPFVGTLAKPAGAGFYPSDMTREEFDGWLAAHPGDRSAFVSERTMIVRAGGGLRAVPYSEFFREPLARAAAHLRKAAGETDNASLKRFLEARARAFETDDYFDSDVAWMDLDAPVEVTIGPYETYEDGLFGYKAAFEAFVTVALPEESRALALYKERLPWLERNLPIPDEYKNLKRGTESPIRVVDVVFASGEAASGVQTIAFNLPNDERVRQAKGSKKVMLHNVIHAKYVKMLVPIAQRTLAPEDASRVTFAAFMDEVLHHELGHGLGPGTIVVNGRPTEVRLELKDLYSTLEEAKADVMGVYDILALIERGDMPAELRQSLEPTYLAGLFRAARFGVTEAHGRGVVSQFNYLLEKGALEVGSDGRWRTVSAKFPAGIKALLHDMLMLQATGDYDGTRAFLERYGSRTFRWTWPWSSPRRSRGGDVTGGRASRAVRGTRAEPSLLCQNGTK